MTAISLARYRLNVTAILSSVFTTRPYKTPSGQHTQILSICLPHVSKMCSLRAQLLSIRICFIISMDLRVHMFWHWNFCPFYAECLLLDAQKHAMDGSVLRVTVQRCGQFAAGIQVEVEKRAFFLRPIGGGRMKPSCPLRRGGNRGKGFFEDVDLIGWIEPLPRHAGRKHDMLVV